MTDWTAKSVLVTGAASGIGLGISSYLAKLGASILMVDMRDDALEEATAEAGGSTVGFKCDVRDSLEVRDAVDAAVSEFGSLDVVVNNAGIVHHEPLLEFDEDHFHRVMDVNLSGCFYGTKYGGAAIVASGGGSIVNIASAGGMRVYALGAAYATSKAAVIALTQVAAIELRDLGVRANVVSPGTIDTPLFRQHCQGSAYTIEAISERQGRLGTSFDIATAVAFLASDEASLITGAVLPVDGGRLVKYDTPAERTTVE